MNLPKCKTTLLRFLGVCMMLAMLLPCLAFSGSAAVYNEHNVMTLEHADEHICTISSRKYTKVYDGKAYVGYFQSDGGYTGPILVGETADSVAFTTTWDSKVLQSGGTVLFEGRAYYYSSREYFMPGMVKVSDEHPLYHCGNGKKMTPAEAALELLSKAAICAGQYTTHQDVTQIVLAPPTCTEPGEAREHCNTCGKDLDLIPLPPAHDYMEYVLDEVATCTKAGAKHRTCIACGHKEPAEIPMLPHSYGDWHIISGSKLIPPILQEHRCLVCNHAETVEDWGYVWVPIVAGVGVVVMIVGVISYAKAFRKKP